MLVSTVMATVGGVGLAFYLRFLLALWKDSQPALIGYWVRLRPDVQENHANGRPDHTPSVTRAA